MRLLKTISILGPVAFVVTFEILRHRLFEEQHPMLIGNLVMAAAALAGGFFFTRIVFGVIERTQKELVRRNEELAAMNSVAIAVSESLDLDIVLRRALAQVLLVTGADSGEIFLAEGPSRDLVQRVTVGRRAEAFRERTRFPLGEGLVGMVAQSGTAKVVTDPSSDPMVLRRKVRESGFSCLACVPLKSRSAVVGVLNIATVSPQSIGAEDLRLLVNIGNQVAVAIENAQLLAQVQSMATLEERERIAREMHDGMAQVLSYINMKSQAVRAFLSSGDFTKAEAHLKELEASSQEVYTDAREAILGLRVTISAGRALVPAVKEYVSRFNQLGNMKVDLELGDERNLSLTPAAQVQAIRIIQEALTNVRKHAGASRARVCVSGDGDQVQISVDDDGRGFDMSRAGRDDRVHFGLLTMKERAEGVGGSLEVISVPGRGTRVLCRFARSRE